MLKGFVSMTLCQWENLEVSTTPPGLDVNLNGPGLGCMLVWPTREEAQENYPNSEIIEVEIGSKEDSTPGVKEDRYA